MQMSIAQTSCDGKTCDQVHIASIPSMEAAALATSCDKRTSERHARGLQRCKEDSKPSPPSARSRQRATPPASPC
ncbi:hypothetical protein TgHK011_000782 [Trichoderma gracile]|nr:hypothetical protein TgHK011_000782 [Trichoderma gracile]